MAKKIYALLVGINDYAPEVGKLAGCLNDVEHFRAYLTDTFKADLALEVLTDKDATRGNIIKMFRAHLGNATADDVALFQYCGHGARWKAAKEFKEFYPDGWDEGLVCYDSRRQGGNYPFDLADKELALLLSEVAANNPHLAVILDCCHSGSGTRDVDAFKNMKPRQTHEVDEERPLDSYLDGYYAKRKQKGDDLYIPASKHILLAACEKKQKAQESQEERSGVFTTTLVEVLKKSVGDFSYADLFVRCRAAVRTRAENQNPQFEPYENFNVYTGFLGRQAAAATASRYSVYFEKDTQNWKIDAGAVAPGIPTDKAKSVGVALYREDDPAHLAGEASITQVGAQTSILEPKFTVDPGVRYQAEITSLPIAPMPVYLEGEPAGKEILQKALQALEPSLRASLGVDLTEIPEATRYALAAEDGKFVLKQRETNFKILGAKGYTEASAKAIFFPALKQVVQWERSLALQNHSTQMNKDEVDFVFAEILDDGKEHPYQQDEITLDYVKSGNEWKKIRGKIKVRNRTEQPLHFLVLYFSPQYGIFKIKNDEIDPSEEYATVWGDQPDHFFALDNKKIDDKEYKVKEEIDNIKLIVSTEKIDDFLLTLDELKHFGEDVPAERGMSTFMPEQKMAHKNEWFTKNLRLKIVRQLDQVSDKETSLAKGQIVVKGHPSVKANLSLSAAKTATRGVGQDFDFYKAFEQRGMEMLNFAGTRGDNESILELTDIKNAQDLEKNPLEIDVKVPLDADTGILPFVFDGQHVVLGGDTFKDEQGNTHISIDHIPEVPDNRRSVGKALKLYFFKTYLKQDNVNQLCWVEYKDDGSIVRHKTMIAEKVNAAQNIVVLVHGIIGDTEIIAKGLRMAGLDQKFDLVLTYDYENLSTPIAETALDLKKKLEAAGFGANDNKKLTLLVHSMGGLVSRWFIEREGGNTMVDHLVMCGTPNNGSPFGKIDGARKILNVLTGVAMNYMPALIPFNGAILFLLNRSKKITPTLEQMNPSSEFITTLNSSGDPGIRYTMLAGDVDEYREPSDQFFPKLLAKAGKGLIFDALFGPQAHDIAAGVESVFGVSGSRNPMPKRGNVACHHLNYFISEAGQKALAGVEW
jgi:pimeloyl-ACP methyl ester carboxylesterase